jgi:hypothetical protein
MYSEHIKMKTASLEFKRVVGWTVVAFALLGCSLSVAAEKSETLSKKEVKNLAASSNPADQQTLADYYKDKAHGLTTKSEEFAKQAEILAKQPATIESKQGISCTALATSVISRSSTPRKQQRHKPRPSVMNDWHRNIRPRRRCKTINEEATDQILTRLHSVARSANNNGR